MSASPADCTRVASPDAKGGSAAGLRLAGYVHGTHEYVCTTHVHFVLLSQDSRDSVSCTCIISCFGILVWSATPGTRKQLQCVCVCVCPAVFQRVVWWPCCVSCCCYYDA